MNKEYKKSVLNNSLKSEGFFLDISPTMMVEYLECNFLRVYEFEIGKKPKISIRKVYHGKYKNFAIINNTYTLIPKII